MRNYEKIIDAEWEEIPPDALRSDGRSTFIRSLYVHTVAVVITIAVGLLIGRILGFFIYGKIL